MKPYCLVAIRWAGALYLACLPAGRVWAQEPAADTQKAPQTQPMVPHAYHLDVKDVLAYQVVSTTRVGAAPPTTSRYRQMVIFDIDGEGNLVVYIGSPDPKAVPTTSLGPAAPSGPRQADRFTAASEHRSGQAAGERRGVMPGPAGERKTSPPEEAEKTQLVWTRHVLGTTFTRNPGGTISFRPPEGQVMPYPLLPLPPPRLSQKERFELTVPDLVLAEDKPLQMFGTYKVSADGRITVDGHMEPKIVPGGMPELGVIGYDIPANAGVVSSIRMSRRPAAEPASQPAREAGEAGRPYADRGARSASAAVPPPAPTTSLLVHLVASKPVPDELRKEWIGTINSAGKSGEPEGSSDEQPAGETVGPGGKGRVITGNLWEQLEQIGTPPKEKTDAAGK
jgi:hypothetical protein